jgi:lactoylglutathione lyase
MKLGYTIIYVADVVATLNFYKNAFKLEIKFIHESNLYGELDTGETTLAFAAETMRELNGLTTLDNRADQTPAGFEIALVTNNVQESMDNAVKKGAFLVKNATPKPWGQIVGYVRDLNGILVEICNPIN